MVVRYDLPPPPVAPTAVQDGGRRAPEIFSATALTAVGADTGRVKVGAVLSA